MAAVTKKAPKNKGKVAEDADEKPAKSKKKSTSGLPDSISKLIVMLRTTDDDGEKRRIRAKLRSLGHTGGLGGTGGGGGKKGKKGKGKKAAKDEDEDEEDEDEDEADDEEAEDEDEDEGEDDEDEDDE